MLPRCVGRCPLRITIPVASRRLGHETPEMLRNAVQALHFAELKKAKEADWVRHTGVSSLRCSTHSLAQGLATEAQVDHYIV